MTKLTLGEFAAKSGKFPHNNFSYFMALPLAFVNYNKFFLQMLINKESSRCQLIEYGLMRMNHHFIWNSLNIYKVYYKCNKQTIQRFTLLAVIAGQPGNYNLAKLPGKQERYTKANTQISV